MKLLSIPLLAATANAAFNITARKADDTVECVGSGRVAYQDAYSVLQALDASSKGTQWESGVPLSSRNAQAVFFDNGYGSSIDTETFGNFVLDILNGCWTQQAQADNLSEAGYYVIYEGDNQAGIICLTAKGASNFCPT